MTRIPLVVLVCGVALALSGCVSNLSPQEETVLPKNSLTEARTTQNDELARFRQFVPHDEAPLLSRPGK